jgi:hypothetical protein
MPAVAGASTLRDSRAGDDGPTAALRLCPHQGGWVTIRRRNGDTFQRFFDSYGRCVSYFAHHRHQRIVPSTAPQSPAQSWLQSGAGLQGSSDILYGANFLPSEIVVAHLNSRNGAVLGQRYSGDNGAVTIPFLIPSLPGGIHDICAVGTKSNKIHCTDLTVLSGLKVQPTQAAPGTRVVLYGTGYRAFETVRAFWNCSSSACAGTQFGSTSTNAYGDFTLSVMIPSTATARRAYAIGVRGADSGRFAAVTVMVL